MADLTCVHCGDRIVRQDFLRHEAYTHQPAGASFQDGQHHYCHITAATPPVSVEVEWEWHLRDEGGDIWTGPFASEDQAQAARRESRPHWIVVRRRRAGPWIEVPPVAATGEGDDRG